MTQPTLLQTFVMAVLQGIVAFIFVFTLVPLTTFAERKVLGYLQLRLGATRVAGGLRGLTGGLNRGMWAMGKLPFLSILRGLPFFIADSLKLFVKEDIVPDKADRTVFLLAPALSVVAALVVFTVICFYPGTLFTLPKWVPIVGGLPFTGTIADINVALLFALGISSVGVYGIVLGAWASNSKYPLLGGMRSAAQMVSYEVPLTLSLIVPVMLSGSLSFQTMSRSLATQMPIAAALPMFIGFFLYMTCGFAETNRLPFDMAEAENELVAGFHTEYAGMRFGFFYLAEYTNMVIVSAIGATCFLGGHYLLPFGLQSLIPAATPILGSPSIVFFLGKVIFLLLCFIWIRGTVPRYRYDQVMAVSWKYLIPVALVNLALAAFIHYVS